jgi:hypothetical protein
MALSMVETDSQSFIYHTPWVARIVLIFEMLC